MVLMVVSLENNSGVQVPVAVNLEGFTSNLANNSAHFT